MTECYCDFEMPSFSATNIRKARKVHRCEACNYRIQSGETYEYTVGKWDGEFQAFATCAGCLQLREYVSAHVPCFCWTYQELHEEALETLREYTYLVPGMGMESGRLIIAGRRRMKEARASRLRTA